MSNHLMNTYARLPIAFERGDGAWLWDETGRRYLDAVSGLGVTALGHAHPAVSAAICEQSRLIMHTANLARIPWQEKLGDRLAHITGLDRAFIGNSGSEAIECALKIIRLAGHERGIDNPGVIVMENSFHGRTIAALKSERMTVDPKEERAKEVASSGSSNRRAQTQTRAVSFFESLFGGGARPTPQRRVTR